MSGPSDSPTPSGSPFAVLKNFTSLYNRGAGIRSPSSPRSNKNASNSERKKEKSSEEKENADNVVLLSDSSQSSKTKSSAGKSSPELRDEWKERTTVITKNDHENNVHIAKEVLEDVVLDIKTPEKDSLPINYLERSNYESESDASFNSFASALQTSFDHKQHRKNIDSDEDYESAADADLSVGSMLVSNHHGSKQFSVLKSMDSCDVDFMTDLMNKISLNVKEDISQVQKEDIISTSNPTFEKYDNPKKEEIESGHLIDENNIFDKNVMTAQSSRCQMSVNDSTELSSDTMCDSLNIKCSIGKEIEEVQSNPSLTKKKISDCENTVILVRNKCSDSNLDSQSFSIGHENDYIISNEENKTNALEQTTNSLLSHSKTTINVTQSGEFEKLTIKTNSSSESPITMMEDPLGKNEKPISECISVVKNNRVKSSSSIKENDSDIFLEENQSLHQDDSPRCSVKKGVDMNDTVNIDSMTDSNLESTTIIDTKKLSLKPDTSFLEGINPISVIKGNQESLKNENACTDQTQVNDKNVFEDHNTDPISTKTKILFEDDQNKFDDPFGRKSKITMEENIDQFDDPNFDPFVTKSKIQMGDEQVKFDDPNFDPFATKSTIQMEEVLNHFDNLNIDPFVTKSQIAMEAVQTKIDDPNFDQFDIKSKIQLEEEQDKFDDSNIDPFVTKSKILMGDDKDKLEDQNIDSCITKPKIAMEGIQNKFHNSNIDPVSTKSKIPMEAVQNKFDVPDFDRFATKSKIQMEEEQNKFDNPNIDSFATKSKIAMEENIDQFDDPNIDPFATKSKIQMEEDPNVDPFATKSKIQMEEQNIDPLVTKSEIPMGDDQDKYDNANIDSVSTKSKITMEENIHTVDDPNIDPFATKSKIAMEEYIDQFDDPNIDPFATKSKIQMEEDPNVDPFATKSKIPMGDDQDKYDNVNIDSVSTKSKITLEENIHAFDDPNIDPFATKSKIAMEKNIDQFDDPNIDQFTTKSKIHTGDDQDEFVDANIGPVATKSKITMEENIDTFDDPNIDPFATKSKIQMEEDPNIDPLVTKSTIHLGDDQDKFDDPNIDPLVTKSRIPVCDDQDKFDDPNIDQFATKSQIQFGEEQNIDPLVTKCKILVGDDQDKFGDPNVDPFVTKSKIQMEEDPNFDKVATKSKIQIEEEQNKFDDLNVDPFLTKSKIQMEDYPDIDVSKSIIPTGDDIGKYDTKSKIQIEEEQNKLKDTFAAKSKISMDESIDQFDDPNFDPFLTKSKIQMGNNQFEDPNIDQFATKSKLLINENINQINHPNVDPFETKSKIPMKDEQDMFEDPNINPFTTKTKIRIADDYLENSEAVIYDSNVPKEIENTNANFAMSDLSSVDPLDSKAKRVLDTTIDITSHPSNNKVVTNNCNIMDIDNINVKAHKKDSTPEFEATEKSIQNESACVVENKDKRRYDFDLFKNEASKIVQSLESKNNVECLENQTTNRFKNQRANEIIDSVQFCKNSIKHALNISSAEPSILLGSGGDFEDCDSICMSNYTNASVSQVREHRTRSELIWQAKLLEMDKEIDTIEKETASMDRVLAKYRYELAQSDKSTQQMMDLIECYEKTAIDIIRERERDRAVMDIEHEKLICERNTLLEDRRSSERAHNDVQRKYERMREVITDYKRNEDELKDVARNISDKCELSIKKYSVLKSHVEEKIKEANYDFEELQAKNKCEIVKLQALSRKADMKNVSLGNTLEQKMSENRELNIICDELINK